MRIVTFLVTLLLSPQLFAQEIAAESIYDYSIRMDTIDWAMEKQLDTVDIRLESHAELGGFNFRIASVVGEVDIIDIVKGDLPTKCRWEFLSSRWQGELELGDRILSVWTVVALPRLMPDSTEKEGPCFSQPDNPTLVKVVVTAGQSQFATQEFSPLFFLWTDCGDNTVSSVRGELLYMSDSVSWSYPAKGMPKGKEFPSVAGSPDHCISAKATDRIKRTINFTNGGIRFSSEF
ncbi:MAG: hypothetical protein P1R58_03995 [bacterium]|nr:hypothetical protein [bacterium]